MSFDQSMPPGGGVPTMQAWSWPGATTALCAAADSIGQSDPKVARARAARKSARTQARYRVLA